jgi:zinc and cadmium transporter
MSPLVSALIATFVVSALAFVGIVLLITEWGERTEVTLLSFAAGVLLATTFLELLPEAVHAAAGDGTIFIATLFSVIAFFLIERVLHGLHAHNAGHAETSGYLILIGDGLHNFIDGVVIAAAFVVSPALGLTTTLAVAAHEIPHEIADYGILMSGKFSRWSALWLNFASGLTAILGALTCFAFEGFVERHLAWFLASTAGMFIYIAASDLIPELHHSRWRDLWLSTVPLLAGVALMALLIAVV